MRPTLVAARAIVLAIAVGANACATPVSDDASANAPASGDPFRSAAATVAAIAHTLDDADTDGFVASSLAGGEPVSASAACLRPDNTVGTRTTPLTNPAFSAAAIDQRERLIRALEAYEALRVAVASDGAANDLLTLAGDYGAALAKLKTSAAAHGPGDLFVDEPAASLDPAGTASSVQTLMKELNVSSDRVALDRLMGSQHAVITKLIVIAFDDASANRTLAEAATLRAANAWQSYAGIAPAAKITPVTGKLGTIARSRALPACDEPFAAPANASPAPDADTGTASAPSMAPSIRMRFEAATAQHQTLIALSAPLGAFFAALSTVNETPTGDGVALQSAFDRFTAAAQQLALAGASLR